MPSDPRRPVWAALMLAGELGFLIILPLLIFALAGRWLDQKFGTSPWLFLSGTLLAIIVTSIILIRKIQSIIKQS